jgi:hypothetical protein
LLEIKVSKSRCFISQSPCAGSQPEDKGLSQKLTKNATTMITVQLQDGSTADVMDKRQIENEIIASNKRKFQQSFSTPFYKLPFNKIFGYQGLTTSSQQVFKGTFTPPPCSSQYMKDFLSHLVMPPPIAEFPNSMSMTVQSFTEFWKKAKENTSCYPSEFCFATLKASSYDNYLATINCIMTRMPLQTGYSPKQWQRCVDVMIKKKNNRTDIDNLRTICLFEVDANYAFKHIGRQMMLNAELHGTIAKEQYGSRKKHKAIDLALNKVLTNDVLRQAKKTGAICSNDAKACYDLIGHAQASLCMQRQGVPKSAVQCLLTTLQEAMHCVRTAYGDSTKTYGGPGWIKPLHGIEQGNGGGPPIWAVISSTLLDILHFKAYGLKMITPISNVPISFVRYSFVDDTDLVQSTDDNVQNTICTLQESINTWEGCLKATGGALGPDKSYWYLVSFNWCGGQWRYAPVIDIPDIIYMKDIKEVRQAVHRIDVHQAEETLGVWISPDGNNSTQFEKLLEKSQVWADQIRSVKQHGTHGAHF